MYGGFRDFRSSWAFILVGHVLYTLPFMVRSVLAVLSSTNFRELEEGAASLGASLWTRLFTVVLPNAKPGILAGSLMFLLWIFRHLSEKHVSTCYEMLGY